MEAQAEEDAFIDELVDFESAMEEDKSNNDICSSDFTITAAE